MQSFCRYQALMILNRTLWKHGRRATLHNAQCWGPSIWFAKCDGLEYPRMFFLFHILSTALKVSAGERCWLQGRPHHYLYSPEKGLRVTLSSNMIKMEYHPCVSFFLLAWRQGCHISWFIAEYKVSICCEELVMEISCVPLKLFTDEPK